MSRARAEALGGSSGSWSSPQRAMPHGDVFREERARAAPGRGRGESFMADAHCLGDGRRAAGREMQALRGGNGCQGRRKMRRSITTATCSRQHARTPKQSPAPAAAGASAP
jgi:hypothetical protein